MHFSAHKGSHHLFVCCSAPLHTPSESPVLQHPLNSQENINTAQAGIETCQLVHQHLYLSVATNFFRIFTGLALGSSDQVYFVKVRDHSLRKCGTRPPFAAHTYFSIFQYDVYNTVRLNQQPICNQLNYNMQPKKTTLATWDIC